MAAHEVRRVPLTLQENYKAMLIRSALCAIAVCAALAVGPAPRARGQSWRVIEERKAAMKRQRP